MTSTTRLSLPLLEAAQAQKHVTHNEALIALDSLVHLAVKARDVNEPPAAPLDGDVYLVGASPSGAFASHANCVAAFDSGGWDFRRPRAGFRVFVESGGLLLLFDGAAWIDMGLALRRLADLERMGVGAKADAINPLSVKANGVLFAAKGVSEGGSGDLRFTLNKEGPATTVSQLYQSNWSGRAETGLTGDDDFHVKVSADGVSWKEALVADRATGKVSAPNGRAHATTGKDIADFVFTPGGDGVVSFYRIDQTHGQNPRTLTVASISSDQIALTTADSGQFFGGIMAGVSYARIWNITKNPNVPAWIKTAPDASRLQVTDAADIAGWSAGDAIQLGDPTSVTPNRVIALDISQMLQNVLGAVFPQKAMLIKLSIEAAIPGGSIVQGVSAGGLMISGSGAGGSFIGANMPADGAAVNAQCIVPCSTLSPISNSNLLFVRESVTVPNTIRTCLASSNAIFV